ncbi:permease of ferrichrome ABC transporter [Klebsiella pneumoniae]|uniref:Permease of ferrichrome ABC transporter n=1 Tax=Klebsiella pneumoniae TaxID=573 RepID=A0A2X3EJD4_KLEPN|nr:permease of ferrichrome ABC transporter [Klebsiella pneumoniae]
MAPHMARFVLRGGQVSLLCGSALIGALLVLATHTLGRLAFAPLQIPAGIVIALVGCRSSLSCSGVAVMPFNQEGSMRWVRLIAAVADGGRQRRRPHRLKLSPMI